MCVLGQVIKGEFQTKSYSHLGCLIFYSAYDQISHLHVKSI